MASSANAGRHASVGTAPLRAVLGADATACVTLGATLVLANAAAARLTGLPASLLSATGVLLFAVGVCVAWVAARRVPPRRMVHLVVAANAAWAIASLVFAAGFMDGVPSPGRSLVLAQACAVAAIGLGEWLLHRRVDRRTSPGNRSGW